ncbi:unnamed protein product, partial [Ostreobium quekettii]
MHANPPALMNDSPISVDRRSIDLGGSLQSLEALAPGGPAGAQLGGDRSPIMTPSLSPCSSPGVLIHDGMGAATSTGSVGGINSNAGSPARPCFSRLSGYTNDESVRRTMEGSPFVSAPPTLLQGVLGSPAVVQSSPAQSCPVVQSPDCGLTATDPLRMCHSATVPERVSIWSPLVSPIQPIGSGSPIQPTGSASPRLRSSFGDLPHLWSPEGSRAGHATSPQTSPTAHPGHVAPPQICPTACVGHVARGGISRAARASHVAPGEMSPTSGRGVADAVRRCVEEARAARPQVSPDWTLRTHVSPERTLGPQSSPERALGPEEGRVGAHQRAGHRMGRVLSHCGGAVMTVDGVPGQMGQKRGAVGRRAIWAGAAKRDEVEPPFKWIMPS